MSRPAKNRIVHSMPKYNLFLAADRRLSGAEKIVMSIEEYEVFRLIDDEGLTQDECAEKMVVSRTTVQRIYKSARSKLAKMLVEGCSLKIEGGSYRLAEK